VSSRPQHHVPVFEAEPPARAPRRTLAYPLARPDLSGNEARYVAEAIHENAISSVGRHVEAFEDAFARFLDVPHAIAVSSGTAALHLALAALDVGPGDEVLIPDLTYVATANAVRYVGATVVLADVDPVSWTLDPDEVERAITPRTRALVAVHLYGNPAALDVLTGIARRRRIALIEDAAQALGATWEGRAAGTVGEIGCFSLYGNKIITTGEGGMLVTRSAALARRLRILRNQAMSPRQRYFHPTVGFNYRLTALQAAVGLAQLERLPAFLEARRKIAAWYAEALAGLDGVETPRSHAGAGPVNWLFTLQMRHWTRAARDACLAALERAGVEARPTFVPMSQLPMYRRPALPVARGIGARALSLPTWVGLDRGAVATIAEHFAGAARRLGSRPAGRRRFH